MSIDGGINHLASYAGNAIMPTLAGLFFAGAVYRYSKGGDAERLAYGGFLALMCSGMLRTVESFVSHAGATGADGYLLALLTFVNYIANVIMPMFALTQMASMALHLGGTSHHIYPGSTWVRKFLAAVGSLMISGIVRLAEHFVTTAHGVGS